MRLLKLAHRLDLNHAQSIDEFDQELIRIAQDASAIQPMQPSVDTQPQQQQPQQPQDVGGDDSGPSSTNLIDPTDNQIYTQLARHVLKNNNEHAVILQRLKALETKLYNLQPTDGNQ